MKKINSRKALNLAMLLLISSIFVIGCVKTPNMRVTPDPNPNPNPTTKDTLTPVFTSLTAAQSPIYWGDSTTLSGTSMYAVSFSFMENIFFGPSFTYKIGPLKESITYNVVAKGPTGITTSKDVKVDVWSEYVTYVCKYGPVKISKYLICREDSISYPSAWKDISESNKNMLSDIYTYYPDGTGFVKNGPYGPNAGTIVPFSNKWTISGKQFGEYTIDTIGAFGFDLHVVYDVQYSNPLVKQRTLLQFRHP